MPDLQPFADTFLHLFQEHQFSHGDDEPITSLTLHDAYQVQQMVIDARIRSGEQVAGYKVGCTSEAIRQQFGLSKPICGCLMAPHVTWDDAALNYRDYFDCAVEPEFVLMIGSDLADEVGEQDDLTGAIDFVSPGIELHNYRFWFGEPTSQELIASNGIHAGLVIGDQKTSAGSFDWDTEEVSIFLGDEQAASGHGREIMGGPMKSLCWLVNHLVQRGESLRAGQLVIPGSPVRLVPVEAGDQVSARFANLGRVDTRFTTDA
jgi:2-keto-4-pentenoate hydratase